MYESRGTWSNLSLTPEYDLCCEALLAHVFGLSVRSKVILLEIKRLRRGAFPCLRQVMIFYECAAH